MLAPTALRNVLKKEGERWMKEVQQSIVRVYPNNDYMRTAGDTMRVEADDTTLIGYGREFFDNLETGIPPLYMYNLKNKGVKHKIYIWTFKQGMMFNSDAARRSFAYLLRRKILYKGTNLWQRGGRKDIYSDKEEPLVNRINSQLSTEIMNYQIIKPENK